MLRQGARLNLIEDVYRGAINDLRDSRIEYLVADRYYIRKMKATDDGQLVIGEFKFKAMVLPELFILPLDVASKIVDFAAAGGRVYVLGNLPEGSTDNGAHDPKMQALMAKLKSLPSVTQAKGGVKELVAKKSPYMVSEVVFESGEFPMLQLHRRIDGRDFFWLVNNTGDKQECTVTVQDTKGLASVWDCETGQRTNISSVSNDKGSRVSLAFAPYEAYWLVFDAKKKAKKKKQIDSESWATAVTLDGSWNIHIDESAQPSPVSDRSIMLGGEELVLPEGKDLPLGDWNKWGLKIFSGFIDYSTNFELDSKDVKVMLSLGKVEHMAEVWVNGEAVGYRLWPPFDFDITAAVQPGNNKLKIRVGNLLCNTMRQFVDKNQKYGAQLLFPVWAWSVPKEKDFDAGLVGPVEVKQLNK